METKNTILELRKSLQLSQDEFAEKLLVTRQAVSRWENGNTIPTTDTLTMIAKTFHVSIDELLGQPAGVCQSCGATLAKDEDKGTNKDGTLSEEYCKFCYQKGDYTQDCSMEELIEHNLADLSNWNKETGSQLSLQEAKAGLMQYLPTLKRWR